MGTVVLKAEVLYASNGCPVCGENKTALARTCRTCYKILGREITRRVDAVRRASDTAKNGHLVSQSAGEPIARDVAWGPILAQVRIDKSAPFRQPGNGIKPYWECRKCVPGGFVSLFVFGAEHVDGGRRVTAWVELIEKDTLKGRVSYLRAQAVEVEVRSNVKLVVDRYNANYIPILPSAQITEQGRRFSVGFVIA